MSQLKEVRGESSTPLSRGVVPHQNTGLISTMFLAHLVPLTTVTSVTLEHPEDSQPDPKAHLEDLLVPPGGLLPHPGFHTADLRPPQIGYSHILMAE
jgi:hypothetical protein